MKVKTLLNIALVACLGSGVYASTEGEAANLENITTVVGTAPPPSSTAEDTKAAPLTARKILADRKSLVFKTIINLRENRSLLNEEIKKLEAQRARLEDQMSLLTGTEEALFKEIRDIFLERDHYFVPEKPADCDRLKQKLLTFGVDSIMFKVHDMEYHMISKFTRFVEPGYTIEEATYEEIDNVKIGLAQRVKFKNSGYLYQGNPKLTVKVNFSDDHICNFLIKNADDEAVGYVRYLARKRGWLSDYKDAIFSPER